LFVQRYYKRKLQVSPELPFYILITSGVGTPPGGATLIDNKVTVVLDDCITTIIAMRIG
jgi:hypothetical protein